MKIAVLSSISRMAGGLFYSVRFLSKALSKLGCEPVVLSPRDAHSAEDIGEWNPLAVELFPAHGPLKSSPAMQRRLMAMDISLIHLHGIWLDSQRIAMNRSKKDGVPVVVSPRGMLDPWAIKNASWKKRFIERLFARRALEEAACIHALCKSEAESIRAYGLKNPVAVIPNGVDLPRLEAKGVTAGKKRMVFLGRIHPKKGIRELLLAWSRLDASWRDEWTLVIAGWDDGGHEAGLRQLAGELRLGDSVEFAGPAYGPEKEQLLRGAEAFILPSFSEGLPMSVLEAWSYGLPVVMTDFCNLPEGFEAGAALRIEPEASVVAAGLASFFGLSAKERQMMGGLGRRLVEERFSWARIAEQMHAVYTWCLNPAGEPPDCIVKE